MGNDMYHVQISIQRPVVIDTQMLRRRRKALQKIVGNQTVQVLEPWYVERVLRLHLKFWRPESAARIVVCHTAKQHDRFQKQEERIGVCWGMVNEEVRGGKVLRIACDVGLDRGLDGFDREEVIPYV